MAASTATLAADLESGLVGLVTGVLRTTPRERSRTATSVLAQLRDLGPQRVTALALREGVAQPTMTGLVNRLSQEGLTERRADPEDGRAVLVAITPAGLETLERTRAARVAVIAERLSALEPAERELVSAALPALHRLATLAHADDEA